MSFSTTKPAVIYCFLATAWLRKCNGNKLLIVAPLALTASEMTRLKLHNAVVSVRKGNGHTLFQSDTRRGLGDTFPSFPGALGNDVHVDCHKSTESRRGFSIHAVQLFEQFGIKCIPFSSVPCVAVSTVVPKSFSRGNLTVLDVLVG